MDVQTAGRHTALAVIAILAISACSRSGPEMAYASGRNASAVAAVQHVSKSSPAAALRLVLAPDGNAARYRVRERLVEHDFPNDAVGETKSLTGAISFDKSGKVIRDVSKFTVDAGTFVSDQSRRDGYVRRHLLEADTYPTITLVPTDVKGVKLPLPSSGTAPLEMTGDLTVRGVTRPTLWRGTARFQNGAVAGSLTTSFTFDEMQIEQPEVPVLLSVADTIKLEIDFKLLEQH